MNNNKTVGANEVAELLRKSDSITLLCHTAPDEDTVCSAYALYLALQGIGKEVKIYSPSKLPPRASSYYDESVFSYSPSPLNTIIHHLTLQINNIKYKINAVIF